MKRFDWSLLFIFLSAVSGSFGAVKTWDGQGASASWGDAANWDGNSLPLFNGSEVIVLGTGFVSGTTLTLDGDRTVFAIYQNAASSLTINPGTPSTSSLTLSGGSLTNTSTAYSQTHNEPVVLGASGIFNVSAPSTSYQVTMNGSISENTPNCSITKIGNRYLALNGSNTFSGGVILSESILYLGHNQALGTGPLRVNAASIVAASGVRTITNNLELATAAVTFGGNSLTFTNPGTVTLFTNVAITVNGAGTPDILTFANGIQESGTNRSLLQASSSRYLHLNGASTFTGPYILSNSTIYAGGTMATTNVVIHGGTVVLNAHNPLGVGKIRILGTVPLMFQASGTRKDLDNEIEMKGTFQGSASQCLIDFNRNGGIFTLTGDLTLNLQQATGTNVAPRFWRGLQETNGSWGITMYGNNSRSMVLSGTSSYSGPTSISNVILIVEGINALPTNTALTTIFSASGTSALDLNGYPTRIGSLAGNGLVYLSGAVLTVGGSSNTTYSGSLSGAGGSTGAGGLTRDGAGVLRLAHTNLIYTGTTRVQSGTLQVDGILWASTGVVDVAGGTLGGTGRINRAVNVLAGGTIQAGLSTNEVGTLTVGRLGLSNDASVAWAVSAVTNDVIEVTNNLTQAGTVTVKVYNLGRAIQPGEQLTLFRFTNSLVGFDASKWEIDFSESPVRTIGRHAAVGFSGKTVYLTGLQSPASPGTVVLIQ